MLCPRCASMTRVHRTHRPEPVYDHLPTSSTSMLLLRRRVCMNDRCDYHWATVELARSDIQAILSDVARRAAAEVLEAKHGPSPST